MQKNICSYLWGSKTNVVSALPSFSFSEVVFCFSRPQYEVYSLHNQSISLAETCRAYIAERQTGKVTLTPETPILTSCNQRFTQHLTTFVCIHSCLPFLFFFFFSHSQHSKPHPTRKDYLIELFFFFDFLWFIRKTVSNAAHKTHRSLAFDSNLRSQFPRSVLFHHFQI